MDDAEPVRPSLFFHQTQLSTADELAILFLNRENQLPLLLRTTDDENEGYYEGKVVNTRFGSFPHSTLIGVPFGSQVRASKVDTGSRGRLSRSELIRQKRKRGSETPEGSSAGEIGEASALQPAIAAESGFGHLLPPTPERWTSSLLHRTQLVYIPDCSYILQRLRARPGSVIIEAGGGTGSFTHAAARAVFNGYPSGPGDPTKGHVWTFELDKQRAEVLQTDLRDHNIDSVVTLTHRDVYADGFALPNAAESNGVCVNASAIFLDLPAPWRALPHLERGIEHSPLDPHRAVHLCTFSPCIEQVQRTVGVLRARGWADIEIIELAARRLEAHRERIGLQEEGLKGVQATPATVDEALQRLRELETLARWEVEKLSAARGQDSKQEQNPAERDSHEGEEQEGAEAELRDSELPPTKAERLQNIRNAQAKRKLYKEGHVVHRSESMLKTHTSYLVFAVLPVSWTEQDEAAAAQWALGLEEKELPKSRKQKKREARLARGALLNAET